MINLNSKTVSLWLLIASSIFFSQSVLAVGLSSYKLGPGDKISIQVTGEDDMMVDTLIGESGSISYPFLGEVKVDGMTVSQLDDYITKALKGPYLVNPDVTVSVKTHRKFFVNGKVERPGGFSFEPGMTVRKAISLAGGFDERANKKRIFVIRAGKVDAKPEKIELDAAINPGDTVTVERSFF